MITEIKWIRRSIVDSFTGKPMTEYLFKDEVFNVKITKVWPLSKDWIFEIRIFDEIKVIASSWELTNDLLPIMTVKVAKEICEHIIDGIDKMNNEKNLDKNYYFQLTAGLLYQKKPNP